MIGIVQAREVDNNHTLIIHRNKKEFTVNCNIYKFNDGMIAYRKGALIQEAFPFLTNEEREFMMSGLLPWEFDNLFNYAEEE